MIPVLDLKAQYESIKDEINAAIAEVLESTQFILGPAVRELEQRVAAYCGCKYGVGGKMEGGGWRVERGWRMENGEGKGDRG